MNRTNQKNNQKKHMKNNKIVSFDFFRKVFSVRKATRFLFLFLSALVLIFSVLLMTYAWRPIDKKNLVIDVDIPTGSSFLEVTGILDKAGLIKNRFLFYSLSIIKRASRHIRAGEYEFNTLITPSQMLNKLIHGDIKQYPVLIREDLNIREIADILYEKKLIHKEIFFELAQDKEFLESMNIKAESIEGYLFPDKYFFNRSMNTRQIMKKMVDNFWKKITPDMIERARNTGLSAQQFITLASLIGKESGNSIEKPSIAAVFYNRMRKGMRLQSDPTAVYDLGSFEGKVLRSHLKRKSPYNTYLIKGLPPGPIGNPGLDSLKATLNPAPVNYLYFVSKNDGSHHFSSSLDEHNQAVKYYISLKNQQKQQLEEESSNDKH
jgi:UPF0755 protein